VTHETEIPAPPKPILEHPDEAAYHKQMAETEEKIDVLFKKSVSNPPFNTYYRKILVSASTRRSGSSRRRARKRKVVTMRVRRILTRSSPQLIPRRLRGGLTRG
jgi:hypothetical protein